MNPSRLAGNRGLSRAIGQAWLSSIVRHLERHYMFRTFVLLLTLAAFTMRTNAAESTNRLLFPVTGFSIKPLETPLGKVPQQALFMALPASDGFAANVNVQIQPYSGTLDEYIALSEEQFKAAGFKVVQRSKQGQSAVVFEYVGEMQGRALHWYAKAVHATDRVYLVTATATETQWKREAVPLKECIDSFRREEGEAGPANGSQPVRAK